MWTNASVFHLDAGSGARSGYRYTYVAHIAIDAERETPVEDLLEIAYQATQQHAGKPPPHVRLSFNATTRATRHGDVIRVQRQTWMCGPLDFERIYGTLDEIAARFDAPAPSQERQAQDAWERSTGLHTSPPPPRRNDDQDPS